MDARYPADIRSAALFAACIALPLAAEAVSYLLTPAAMPAWFVELEKPVFTPPVYAFWPVWIAVDLLAGAALFLVLRNGLQASRVRTGAGIFAGILVLNILWTPLFYGLKSPVLGLIILLALVICVSAAVVEFRKIDRRSGWLMVPYLCWILFAVLVNAAVVVMN